MNEQIQTWSISNVIDFLMLVFFVSTAVLSIAWAVNRWWHNKSAAAAYRIWLAAFLLVLIVPVGMVAIPKWQVAIPVPNLTNTQCRSADRADEISVPVVSTESSSPLVLPPDDILTTLPISQIQPTKEITQLRSNQSTLNSTPASIKTWLVYIWMSGALVLLIRSVGCHLRVAFWRRNSVEFDQPIDTGVPIRISKSIDIPISTGIAHPIILLPVSACHWGMQRIEMVLWHELAHVHRQDVLWNSLVATIKSLYWFQPLLWLGHAKMSLQREQACDDAVIAKGANARKYAGELVAIMKELLGKKRSVRTSGALAISEPPLETRLRSILGNRNRNDLTRNKQNGLWIIILFSAIAISTIRPFAIISNANDEVSRETVFDLSQSDELEIPETLSGRVVDDNGMPIDNAEVRLGISLLPTQVMGPKFRKFGVWQTRSDSSGQFQFSIPPDQRKPGAKIQAFLQFKASGFVALKSFVSAKKLFDSASLEEHRLSPGRLLSGRLVKPKEVSYGPVKKGKVRFFGLSSSTLDHQPWHSLSIDCEPDGTFQCYVPRSGKFSYIAASENYAPVRGEIEAPQEFSVDQYIGEIHLASGSTLFGKVLDNNNRPLAGAIVNIQEQQSNQTITPKHPMYFCVKTNEQGYYQFHPLTGQFVVSLAQTGTSTFSSFFESAVTDIEPPVVMPVPVDLNSSGVSVHLNLRPATTVSVDGRIKFETGRPAVGVPISSQCFLDAHNAGVTVAWALTDQNGQYAIEVPAASRMHHFSVSGKRLNGEFHYAYPTESYDAIQKSCQILSLENNKTDLTGIDWELRSRSKTSNLSNAKKERTINKLNAHQINSASKEYILSAADKELLEISREYYAASGKYATLYQHLSEGKQKEKLIAEQREFTYQIFQKLFKFESEYRGDVASINAMGEIIRQCCNWAGESRDKPQIEKAYRRAIKTLKEHYSDHECIWLVFSNFDNAFPPDRYPKELVQSIRNNNKFPLNRCYAHYSEMDYLYQLLYFRDFLQRSAWKTNWMPDKDMEFFKSMDRDQTVAQINKHVAIIQKRFAGLKRPRQGQPSDFRKHAYAHYTGQVGMYLSFINRRINNSNPRYKEHLFTQLAANIGFKAGQLVIGKPFPVRHWNDQIGNAVSNANGKPVLLMITYTYRNDEGYRSAIAKAAENKNLQVIWLRSNETPVDPDMDALIKDNVSVIYDQPDMELAIRWNQANSEAHYLIDNKGILRAIDIDLTNIVDQIETLTD